MRKILLVTAIAFTLIFVLIAGKFPEDESKSVLKNQLKSQSAQSVIKTIIDYNIKNGTTVSINPQSVLNKMATLEDSVPTYKMDFEYKTGQSSGTMYEWRPTGWKPGGKYTWYFKSELDKPDSTLSFSYDSIAKTMVYEIKTINYYNAAGRDTSEIMYSYDKSIKKWKLVSRTTNHYNAQGKVDLEQNYTRDEYNAKWILTSKNQHTYSGNLEMFYESFYWFETKWMGMSKIEYAYYPSGFLKSETYNSGDFMSGAYKKSSLSKHVYKNELTDTTMNFRWLNEIWQVGSFEKYFYLPGSKNIKSVDTYEIPETKSLSANVMFIKTDVVVYLYDNSGNTGIDNRNFAEVTVFPNPVKSTVQVFVPSPVNCRLDIFDINGRLIQSKVISDITTQVQMEQFKKGLYIFRINNNGSMTKQKILKN